MDKVKRAAQIRNSDRKEAGEKTYTKDGCIWVQAF